MSNSALVTHVHLSPNNSGLRTHEIDRFTPHCVVGQVTVESLGNIFAPPSRGASSNYGIGKDGRYGMYVEENKVSWCTSSSANDNRAITVECASDVYAPWAFNEVVYEALINLCVDCCKRNGKTKTVWLGSLAATNAYTPKSNEMVLTVHRWYKNKSCPGDWMYERMPEFSARVNMLLSLEVSTEPEDKEAAESIRTTDVAIYRVQLGAFKNRTYADNYVEQIVKDVINYGFLGEKETKEYKEGKKKPFVFRVGDIYRIQVGAFGMKANAEAYRDKFRNFTKEDKSKPYKDAFIAIEFTAPAKKSVEEIAKEVILGKWGSGQVRKEAITAAGYNYEEVRSMVNEMLS